MKTLLFIIFIIGSFLGFSQDKVTFSGQLTDGRNGELLIGAKVYFPILNTGAVTNNYGYFSIEIPKGNYEVQFRSSGLETITKQIDFSADLKMDVELGGGVQDIVEVKVNARKSENVNSAQLGKMELQMDEIKKLPAFMGEVDLVKAIQLLPGVSSASEGGQGFYVRGGGPDQNLVLLDEAVVYNASHLFGFFSVFNADAVKNVNLIKGGMPANFGGRMSSVLEVNLKEGNNKRFGVSGGIGVISSRLTVEGPIVKNKGSFIISARRTYIDGLMKAFIKDSSPFSGSGYYFYDLNFKANYKLGPKDHIYLSAYYGKDEFKYGNKKDNFSVNMPWGNGVGSFRWNHLFNSKLFLNVSATFSDYKFSFISKQDEFIFDLSSGIRDYGGKMDFSYFPNSRHKIKFGAQYTYHIFTPTSVSATQGETVFDTGLAQNLYSHETGLYVLDEYDISENIKINAGLRYSTFSHTGKFTRYIKGDISKPDSSISYKKGELIKFYQGLEPRASIRFLLPDKSAIKGGYSYNYQYVHLASLSAVSLPTDIWYPTTSVAKPQIGWQTSLGYFRNLNEDMYESSVEVYYKGMNNLIEFKEGSLPTDNLQDNTDNLLTFGKGWSYGIELFFKKTRGKFTGWMGYTWSKTERKFAEINNGEVYPAKYDRRHDLSIVGSYEFNKRWSVGAAFIYATGNTLTLPSSWYLQGKDLQFNYGPRNSTRMPNYHRLDLSVTWTDKATKKKLDPATNETIEVNKRFRSNWVFSVYNAYNRANPYFLYVDNDGNLLKGDFQIKVKQVTLFPIIPSITWNFQF